ncbi:MAG: hypothetical protein IH845_01540 [Nanoarchaeota archaeon]|nr:hypothetical protein [Nanoarchaeota archaeon]
MKTIFYIISLVTLLILGALLIFLDTKSLNEDLSLVSFVNFDNIAHVADSSDPPYLQSAEVKIGDLVLKNTGYFEKKYTLNEMVGCITLKNNQDNSIQFYVGPKNGNQKSYSSRRDETQYTISAGETKKVEIYGVYSNNPRVLLSDFDEGNLGTIKIFEIPNPESNPFIDGRSSYSERKCNYLLNNDEPIKEITII